MPRLRHDGICSASTVAFRISVSQVMINMPPYFTCSAMRLSGPVDLLPFILFTVASTSSVVKATSRKTSSFSKVSRAGFWTVQSTASVQDCFLLDSGNAESMPVGEVTDPKAEFRSPVSVYT